MQRASMRRIVLWIVSAAIATLMLISYGGAQTKLADGVNERGAPLFNDLGNHQHAISTKSPEAQRYFNQGLILTYGFNHGEAIRSFKEAIRLDSNCAMCYWGVALALGPNINKPMDAADVPRAWDALQQAKRLAAIATEKERAYINALAARYSSQPVADRRSLDLAYANAMRDVMKRYPDDLDAATLFAEAVMDTMPWEYYTEDRRPKAVTEELVRALEFVIAKDPHHPGANHFYIHAVEASPYPERALPSAERLGEIAPGAGHLVHMPSHIYLRVGRYHDATLANEEAVKADQSYIAQCRAQGFYPVAYYPHNQHFLWYTSGMEGRSELSIRTAREIDRMNEHQNLAEGKRFSPLLILTLARFGKWDEALSQPKPPAPQPAITASPRFSSSAFTQSTPSMSMTRACDSRILTLLAIVCGESELSTTNWSGGSTSLMPNSVARRPTRAAGCSPGRRGPRPRTAFATPCTWPPSSCISSSRATTPPPSTAPGRWPGRGTCPRGTRAPRPRGGRSAQAL